MDKSDLATGGHPSRVRDELEQGIAAFGQGQGQLIFQIKVAHLAQIIHICNAHVVVLKRINCTDLF